MGVRVLVTGGTGFVGRHLIRHLESLGYHITVLSHSAEAVKGATVIQGDILSANLDGIRVDGIIHLAGKSFFDEVNSNPLEATRVNVLGTHRMLELAKSQRAFLLFASTCYVYGELSKTPFEESDDVMPNTLLGETKYEAERLCQFYATQYGIDVVVLRFFTLYGPGANPQQFIPFLIREIMSKNKIELRDPEATRDFVYVTDAVRAIANVLERRDSGFGLYNVGTGIETSVEVVVQKMIEIHRRKSGRTVEVKYTGEKRSDEKKHARMLAKITRLKARGWSPEVSLDQGLLKTYEAIAHEFERSH